MRVNEVMTKHVRTVDPEALLADASNLMRLTGIHHLVVAHGRQVVGVLSERDARGRRGLSATSTRRVADAMASPAVTVRGTILGTAAYMSPEQANGQSVDQRADIWAFGCVLFEMLTGRPPFEGDTMSDTFVSILEREPEWVALPAATPAPIRRPLERCLRKDPRKRLHDIADAILDIDDAATMAPIGAGGESVVSSGGRWSATPSPTTS